MVVVEDMKPPVIARSDSVKLEEYSIVTIKMEEREMDEEFDDNKVEMSEMVKSDEDLNEKVSVLVTPSDDDRSLADGLKLPSESDAVVEVIQVDLQEPGVTVVNGSGNQLTCLKSKTKMTCWSGV